MASPNKKIHFFISYRREDDISAFAAHWFKRTLEKRFGNIGNVFLDDDDISHSLNLSDEIQNALNACDVMVVIVGPNWRKGYYGDNSIANPEDWVHKEIKHALNNQKIEILTIWMDSEKWKEPKPFPYPPELEELNFRVPIKLKRAMLASANDKLSDLFKELDKLATRYKYKSNPIAFVTSTLTFTGNKRSIDGLDYFTTLLSLILKKVSKYDRDVVIKVPEFTSSDEPKLITDNQIDKIKEVLDNFESYQGLIIAPFEVGPVIETINWYRRTRRGFANFPIAAIDKGFSEYNGIKPTDLIPLFSMENNGIENGKQAAQCFITYLLKANRLGVNIEKSNVVIMKGREGSEPRIKGFCQHIDEQKAQKNLDIEYIISDPIDFTTDAGKQAANIYLEESQIEEDFPNRPKQIHAFFCSNDEIALGVELALEKNKSYERYDHPIVIIGFDSIRAFTVRLSDSKFFLNTINTLLHKQVEELVKYFFNFIEDGVREPKFESIPGEPFLGRVAQERRIKKIVEEHQKIKEIQKAASIIKGGISKKYLS